jgi:hypothetical protein
MNILPRILKQNIAIARKKTLAFIAHLLSLSPIEVSNSSVIT